MSATLAPLSAATGTEAVVLDQVQKSFGDVRAVKGVSARIRRGQICGFLGPNGAGKTTLLRMMLGIICPDQGEIRLLGKSPGDGASDRIGYLPEERGLYRKMQVKTVLMYLGCLHGASPAVLTREIPRWLEAVGLAEWSKRKVEDLSKGMQQKLQFVATVLHDPELVILDEPFSGLDPINMEMLKTTMLQMRNDGKTVIFSTHVMEQAEKLCDSIVLINRGQKIVDGPLKQILSQFKTNEIIAVFEGDANFVAHLPMVKEVRQVEQHTEIALADGCDSQDLLKALVDRVRVVRFEEKVPSLHETFVRLVGRTDE